MATSKPDHTSSPVSERPGQSTPTDVPATRAFTTTVVRSQRLTPHFQRVTVTGPGLADFGPQGTAATAAEASASPAAWDQRIKLFLPREDGGYPEVGLFADPPAPMMQWYAEWRQLDDAVRNPIRTYTVREIRTARREVDIDFVLHQEDDGSSGPAAAWALGAGVGDELIVIGPDRRSTRPGGGIDFTPGSARDLLLAGDETAVPAICAILEALPESYSGEAYLEVPSAADVMEVSTDSNIRITWLTRQPGQACGEELIPAVHDWGDAWVKAQRASQASSGVASSRQGRADADTQELPEVQEDAVLWETAEPQGLGQYVWLAGEAGVVTMLRRHLVKEVGLSRKQVSFMGYWKHGRPGA